MATFNVSSLPSRRSWLAPTTWLAAISAASGFLPKATAQSLPTPAATPASGTALASHEDGPLETRLDPLSGTLLSYERWPAFPLVEASGRQVDLYQDLISGQTVVLSFFYTECRGSCPVTTGRLIDLWKVLSPDQRRAVRFISISLEPEVDTPAVLTEWGEGLIPDGADWRLLTGSLETITALRRHLGFYDLNPTVDADPRRHAAMVMMGNDRTHRWLTLPAISTLRQWRSTLARCSAPV